MKRYVSLALAMMTVLSIAGAGQADWRSLTYGGFQPWWNPFGIGKRHCLSPEERRLQRFWHDYYDAQRRYYRSLEHLDWVSYYKNHGQSINGGGNCGYGGCQQQQAMQFAPVTVNPAMAWAVPPGGGGGCGPGGCNHGAGGHAYMPQGQAPMMGMYPGYGAPGMPMSAPVAPAGYSPVNYYYGQ